MYLKETALIRGARMPHVPAFGIGPPGFLSPGISPVHNLHPRMHMSPVGRGLPIPGEVVSTLL